MKKKKNKDNFDKLLHVPDTKPSCLGSSPVFKLMGSQVFQQLKQKLPAALCHQSTRAITLNTTILISLMLAV